MGEAFRRGRGGGTVRRAWRPGGVTALFDSAPTRLRYTGVAAVVTLWLSIGAGLVRTGLSLFAPDPLSYLGTDPRSRSFFTVGLLVAAVLLAAFFWFVHRRFSPPLVFLVAAWTGLVGQAVVAVVPLSGPGASPGLHTAAGLVLGGSLPVLMGGFAAGQPPGPARRVSFGLFALEVAACIAGVVLSAAMRAPIAEALPAGAFHLWIILVTRWSPDPTRR